MIGAFFELKKLRRELLICASKRSVIRSSYFAGGSNPSSAARRCCTRNARSIACNRGIGSRIGAPPAPITTRPFWLAT